jgi:5-methylcytosine-specific restriction protein A
MPIQIGPKLCKHPTCSRYQPCPVHAAKPFESSTRRQSTASGWAQQRDAQYVLYRDDTRCHICGLPGATQVDHVIPINEGGADSVDNKAPIHKVPCHQQKTADEAARGRARQQGE